MSEPEQATVSFEVQSESPRSESRFASFGARLSRTLERAREEFVLRDLREAPPGREVEFQDAHLLLPPEDVEAEYAGRFERVLNGYDPIAVDGYLDQVERELIELRDSATNTINEEITRFGQHTAGILREAHDQASEIVSRAERDADRLVSEARSAAEARTRQAEHELHQLDNETDIVWRERERMLADVRRLGRSLLTLADAAPQRFTDEATRSQAGAVDSREGAMPAPAQPPMATAPVATGAPPIAPSAPVAEAPAAEAPAAEAPVTETQAETAAVTPQPAPEAAPEPGPDAA